MKHKILVIVDNWQGGWCWTTTANNIVVRIPEFEFDVIKNEEFVYEASTGRSFEEYQLIWFRGYANAALNDKTVNQLKTKFISTIGTGGKKLEIRLDGAEKIAKKGYGLIVQNYDAVHAAKKRGYDNIWMIPNGVDLNLFHPSEKKRKSKNKTIGIAANVKGSRGELKGKHIIEEVARLSGMEYKEVNSELPLSHESMADWYRTIDYYIQPSHSEGCSNSVMEAMASGLPVFICDGVGYHGEVCRDAINHEDGQVIFVRRNEKEIVDKIKILEENPYIYERCIKNAITFARNHEWKNIAVQYKKVFYDVLNMKEKPTRAMMSGFSVGKTYYVRFNQDFIQKNGKKRMKDQNAILRKDEYEAIKDKCEVIK